jgi:ABC-2 type transport system permease protein
MDGRAEPALALVAPPARTIRIARGLWQLCRSELVLFLREPAAVFFTLLFPQALLIFVGFVYGDETFGGSGRFIDEYVPTVMAIVVANLGLLGVAFNIAEARVRGVLVRYRLIPLPFWCYFVSQAVVGLLMFAVSIGGLLLTAGIFYGLRFSGSIPVFAGILLLGLTVMFQIGLLLGGLDLTVRTTQLAGTALFFVVFFGSGAAIPRSQFPDWLYDFTTFNPLTPVVDALVDSYLGRSLSGDLPGLAALGVLSVALAIAIRRSFRWEAVR